MERQVDKVWADNQIARLRRQLMVSAMGIYWKKNEFDLIKNEG
jgi:hypothetical protein